MMNIEDSNIPNFQSKIYLTLKVVTLEPTS